MVANKPLFIFVANTHNDIRKCSGVVIPLTTNNNNNTFLFLSEEKYVWPSSMIGNGYFPGGRVLSRKDAQHSFDILRGMIYWQFIENLFVKTCETCGKRVHEPVGRLPKLTAEECLNIFSRDIDTSDEKEKGVSNFEGGSLEDVD
ncbi:hypothetical protein V8E53_004941 [Lactarius tabidus]